MRNFSLRTLFSESEADDEVIDERPLENKSDNFNNLMNHVSEPTASVSFSDEEEQKVRLVVARDGNSSFHLGMHL